MVVSSYCPTKLAFNYLKKLELVVKTPSNHPLQGTSSHMSLQRFLTGITTTGTPHLGNYVGAIRPAIEASQRPDTENFYFLADYHALIKCHDPAQVMQSRIEIAATWLAFGLDPDRAVFYRQSDVPEILELNWMLSCLAAKGLMNRAHAYKAVVQENVDSGASDPDKGVTMGLFGTCRWGVIRCSTWK